MQHPGSPSPWGAAFFLAYSYSMANLDVVEQASSNNPLDLVLTAATPHGYGVAKDGKTSAVKIVQHAPKVIRTPRQNDHQVVNDVMDLFQKARNYRRPMVSKWKRDKRALFNRQLPGSMRREWMPSPLIPEIMPLGAALVGWMTDQRVGYTVAPAAVPHSDYFNFFQAIAQDLEAVMDATWQVNNEESEWTQCLWDAFTYGTGFMKTTWDMVLSGGQGDAISRRVSPFSLYPDPAANSLDDCEYIVEAKMMSCGELGRRFPGAEGLFPDGGWGDVGNEYEPTQLDEGGDGSNQNIGNIGGASYTAWGKDQRGGQRDTNTPAVLVLECWIRENNSYDTVDPQSGETETRTYDTWRVVVVAGDKVLMDEPVDNLWSHGKHPYSRLVLWNHSEFWGRSLVEELSPCQIAINRILMALQQNVELTGNPILKQNVNGPSIRGRVENKPGLKIPVSAADNGATGWLNPPQMNQQMLQLLNYYLQRMEEISGISGIAKGAQPGGRPSQSIVDSLQESVFVRVRQHLRELEYAMRDAGFKRASLICENYTTPRMMAIAGPSGERTSLTLKSRHFLVPTSEGAVPMKFMLQVDAGSRLHTSRSMREDREIQLFTLGAIDRTGLLEGINYANAGQVAKRMDERDAQMAAMGAAAAPGARQRAGH